MAFSLTRMQSYLLILFTVLVLGTIAIMEVEGLSPFDAFYFVVVTIATVGYGDISPSDIYGKAITIIIIIAGVGTFVAVFADMVETLLSGEERRSRRRKINMIVGLFFSEIGTDLLRMLSSRDPCIADIRKEFLVSASWTPSDFEQLRTRLNRHRYCVTADSIDLTGLKHALVQKREFLLSLLENPVIFEHDSFTGTLQAFFHLTEELMHRKNLSGVSRADAAHLVHDVNRGYRLLVFEWVTYMEHLKEHYPYLFSLAMRTNPFDPEAQAEISDQDTDQVMPGSGITDLE
ncbi:MAG: potassium channel family protein [Methanoregulaceae archaeon]|nr:potassium channel family protein [Methanoregulaceae archaeon]